MLIMIIFVLGETREEWMKAEFLTVPKGIIWKSEESEKI